MIVNLHEYSHNYHTVTSTNDVLYQMACEGAPSGTVLTASYQSKGKGSYGREWLSEDADNIYCSVLLKTALSENESTILPIATALGIARALRFKMNHEVWIKWPNDVIVCDRKVCGILAEYHEYRKENFLIIGFGVNVNQKVFPQELKEKASSMYLLEGHPFDTAILLEAILTELEEIYGVCISDKSLEKYQHEISQCLIRKGSTVYLIKGRKEQEVILNGINADGSLNVMTTDKKNLNVYAGELSLRGKGRYI